VFEYSQFDFTKFYLRFAHTMSRKRLAALLRGTPEGAPVFTAVEVAVITRNAVLSALIQDNPWAVRRVLDALAAISTTRIMQARRRERGACRCHNRSARQSRSRPTSARVARSPARPVLLKEAQPGSGGAKPQTPVKPASR